MRRFKGVDAHFSFNKWHVYTQYGASAKLSTNSHETDNSASVWLSYYSIDVQIRDMKGKRNRFLQYYEETGRRKKIQTRKQMYKGRQTDRYEDRPRERQTVTKYVQR